MHHIKWCVINMGSGVERCCLRGSCRIHEFISCFYSRLGVRLQQPLYKVRWLELCIHLLASVFQFSLILYLWHDFLTGFYSFYRSWSVIISFLCKDTKCCIFSLCFGWNFRLVFLKEWPHVSVQWQPALLPHCLWKIASFWSITPLCTSSKGSAPQ